LKHIGTSGSNTLIGVFSQFELRRPSRANAVYYPHTYTNLHYYTHPHTHSMVQSTCIVGK